MIFEVANAITSLPLTNSWKWIFGGIDQGSDFILLIISIFVLISFILSIIFILYWALLLILSWWKEDKIKPAINTIRYAILWIIITIASIFLFPLFGRLMWLDVETYAKPELILNKISSLWDIINWGSSVSKTSIWDIKNDIDLENVDFEKLE